MKFDVTKQELTHMLNEDLPKHIIEQMDAKTVDHAMSKMANQLDGTIEKSGPARSR